MHHSHNKRRLSTKTCSSVPVHLPTRGDGNMNHRRDMDVERRVRVRPHHQGGELHARHSMAPPVASQDSRYPTKPKSRHYKKRKTPNLDASQSGTAKDSRVSRSFFVRGTITLYATLIGLCFFWILVINLLVAPRFHEHQVDFMWHHDGHDGIIHVEDDSDKRKLRLRNLASVPLSPQRPLPPRDIPLPVPSNKVSVVLINYSRPRMIKESSLMSTLLAHPNVDEILLLHANPRTAFVHPNPKVVNIDASQQNDEMGLSLRFYFCQLAKHQWVLHVDDDMEFPASTLNELLIEFNRNSQRIVGRFGRNLHEGNSFLGYSSKDAHKSAEVVLTKLMVMERDMCESFFEYADFVWDEVVLRDSEGPLWNGEDIFMSLVANHEYDLPTDGRKFNNYAMDWLNVSQAPDSLKDYDNGELDISGGMSGFKFWDWHWYQSILRRNRHYSYRGRLWHVAKKRLDESPVKLQRQKRKKS